MVENHSEQVESGVEPQPTPKSLKSLAMRFLKVEPGDEKQVEPPFNPTPPKPPKNDRAFQPRFRTPKRVEKDHHRYAFLNSPERLDRIRMGRKAEGLLRQHELRRGGDETDETGRLLREGGGWWECPHGHTYEANGPRWQASLMWHDFHKRYFCFCCHHSWSFEEMKHLLKQPQR